MKPRSENLKIAGKQSPLLGTETLLRDIPGDGIVGSYAINQERSPYAARESATQISFSFIIVNGAAHAVSNPSTRSIISILCFYLR